MLGFSFLLSLFEIAIGKENAFHSLDQSELYNFLTANSVDNSKHSLLEELKVENKDNILLTLKIFADKQYDYDQEVYLAEGNVKAIINNGTLRSDSLKLSLIHI